MDLQRTDSLTVALIGLAAALIAGCLASQAKSAWLSLAVTRKVILLLTVFLPSMLPSSSVSSLLSGTNLDSLRNQTMLAFGLELATLQVKVISSFSFMWTREPLGWPTISTEAGGTWNCQRVKKKPVNVHETFGSLWKKIIMVIVSFVNFGSSFHVLNFLDPGMKMQSVPPSNQTRMRKKREAAFMVALKSNFGCLDELPNSNHYGGSNTDTLLGPPSSWKKEDRQRSKHNVLVVAMNGFAPP